MLRAVHGVYRNGRVELLEGSVEVADETPVVVTFLETSEIELRERGIDLQRAADLRGRLSRFAEDWNSPEMDIYDSYPTRQHA